MLVNKDQEISKLRQKSGKKGGENKESAPSGNSDVTILDANSDNSGIESDSSDEEGNGRSKDRNKLDGQFGSVDQTSRAYIKNVLVKYLEYQAQG